VKHRVPGPKTAAVANEVAQPVSLPLTGENVVLVAVLGAGIAGAGVVIRRRIERC
jgi:LPXTG-motif cell wall-anchored protein